MDRYLTGATIKGLRERRGMTQTQLAGLLCVSDKAVSKWETGAGYPDITLLEPIAGALGASVAELLSGFPVANANVGANMLKSRFYVYPEGPAQAYFKRSGVRNLYAYCNRDGLFAVRLDETLRC